MFISSRRLGALLAPSGFITAYDDQSCFRMVFTRASGIEDLFELVVIHALGSRGNAVPARVGCAIVPGWTALRGLYISELLSEIADSHEAGVAEIENFDAAVRWERSLADIAPNRAAALAGSKGRGLLADTVNSRRKASDAFSALDLRGGVKQEFQRLCGSATRQQLGVASALIRCPGTMNIPGGWDAYDLASLSLVVSDRTLTGPDLSQEHRIALHILASRISDEPGWNLRPKAENR
jgi:hypothetical protein